MKVNPILKDEVKLHAEKQIEKKTVFIGSQKLIPGHRCFEINEVTGEVVQANYLLSVNFNSPDSKEVLVKPNCVYINALNAKNALKIYNKGGRKEIKPFLTLI